MALPATAGAVVFDLDGTLIDSLRDVTAATNRALADHGRRSLALAEVRAMIGWGARSMLRMAFEATGEPLASDGAVTEAVAAYQAHYRREPTARTVIYPGAVEVLETLKASGRRLGICTNKPYAATEQVLEALDLRRLFDGITGGDNVPHCKPDGRHVHRTLELMGADAAGATMVGDSETDMAAARNAGVAAVGVSWGYSHGPAGKLDADRLINRFHDLPAALASLAGAAVP